MTVFTLGAMVLVACLALLGVGVAAGLLWILWRVLKAVFWVVARALGFVKREVIDTVHATGALITALATLPLVAVNLTILRLSAARHYARAIGDELKSVGVGLWRVALGNPLRLVGLSGLVDGIEQRLPDVVERAPRVRRTRRATFDGYDVVGTLPSGGSGAQLFVARPKSATHRRFLRAGRSLPAEVVIKSFALEAGSTLPQIVRESRALEAASRLGLVCEHQLADDHFYYVMPYVKGEDLERVIRTLHGRSSPDGLGVGLGAEELGLVLGYASDLLEALQRFHGEGLWHKDVKPANVIVASGRAHLVDFGLVTPLASAMTLTTHGTEYYRDPEMVRLALQGVKVHEVDGVRFDLYSAGAVLYSLVENSFPAHGSLSRITKRCPEALRWIVQRAMAEMRTRYGSAQEMRADLQALAAARDPFALRPADLPSFARAEQAQAPLPEPVLMPSFARAGERPRAASYEAKAPSPMPPADPPRRRRRPALALAAGGLFGICLLTTSAFLVLGRERAHARFSQISHSEPRSFARRWSGSRDTEPAAGAPTRRSTREREVPERDAREGNDLERGSIERDAKERSEGPSAEPAGPESIAPPSAPSSPGLRAAESALASAAPASAPGARGRVLVLDDLASGVDARVLALVREQITARGFTLIDGEGDADQAAAAVELIAGARHAIGLGRADEAETELALQRFLDHTEGLDALLLVSRNEAGGEGEASHLYRVFLRAKKGAPGATPSAR